MKFLVVEDNAEMRRLIIKVISGAGDTVYECADGAQALPAYRAHIPDWVLMDIRMPVLDGIQATRRIVENFPDARIVIVTDYDDEDLSRVAADAGAVEYIVKENLFDLRRVLKTPH